MKIFYTKNCAPRGGGVLKALKREFTVVEIL